MSVVFTPVDDAPEPLTLDDAKLYLKIDQTVEDAEVGALITAARTAAEKYLNRCIISTTVVLSLDCFPPRGIRLSYGPVQSITSIQVTDASGTTTTWDPANYIKDVAGARIVYSPAAVFPDTLAPINGVTVTYVCGYTTVPGAIVQAIRHLVAAMYENRAEAGDETLAYGLLYPFKVITL